MVARNELKTHQHEYVSRTSYGIIIQTAHGVLDQFAEIFAKGRASSRYIHLFDLTFAFFTNLHERYSFFHYLKR